MRKIVSIIIVLVLAASLLPAITKPVTVNAKNYGLSNPKRNDVVVTWDCVWFGSYPQSSDGNGGYNVEPIKWRVLSVDGDDAFLLADKNLDYKKYNETRTDVTWENCTLRSWLNGYGASSNKDGIDYGSDNFIDKAFTSAEQSAIKETTIKNNDNPRYGTEGGNNTKDKIYLLSLNDVMTSSYGFSTDYLDYDNARVARNTQYAEGKAGWTPSGGAEYWWLRSPGYSLFAASVYYDGYAALNGINVYLFTVRPALHLNLASSSLWSYAGTVTLNVNNLNNVNCEKTKIVNNKTTSITKIKSKKKKLKVTWDKVNGINGYKLQYSLKRNFKGAKTIVIKKASTTSSTIKKLKRKKRYYLRIRTYKIVNGKNYYSAWSDVKAKKTK